MKVNDRSSFCKRHLEWKRDGFLLDTLLYIFFRLYTVADFLKMINQDYSNLLTAFFSCLLFVVTAVYVIFTYNQFKISKKSIALNIDYLKQLESEHKTYVTPVLVPIDIKTRGGGLFQINGSWNRLLHVFCNMKNIGNSPAIQIYTKIGLKLKFVKDNEHSTSSEYRYIGALAINDNIDAIMSFERDKLSSLLEDISIMLKKNTDVLRNNNSQKIGSRKLIAGATLVIDFVYSNIHKQYYKTVYERDIIGITAFIDENNKRNYLINELTLSDNEQFELMLINPSSSRFDFTLLSEMEAEEFIIEAEEFLRDWKARQKEKNTTLLRQYISFHMDRTWRHLS